jgi:hypothetical protein
VLLHDTSGISPLAHPSMFGWIMTGDRTGHTTGQIRGDAAGLFTVALPASARLRIQALTTGLYQPCAATFDGRGNAIQDVRVISDVRRLGASLPPELLANGPLLSGVVFEQTPTAGSRWQTSRWNSTAWTAWACRSPAPGPMPTDDLCSAA